MVADLAVVVSGHMQVVDGARQVVLVVDDALCTSVPVDVDVRVLGIGISYGLECGFVVCVGQADQVLIVALGTVEDVHEDDLGTVLPRFQTFAAGFLEEAQVLVEGTVELLDVCRIQVSEGDAAGVVVRAAFQDDDVEVGQILDVLPLVGLELGMAAVCHQHGLVVQDAVVDDSRVVRHHDRAADGDVIHVRAGLLRHTVRDRVVHGGGAVRGADDQRIAFEEDVLPLQLSLVQTEPGVVVALQRDGRVAFVGTLTGDSLDRDEVRAGDLEDTLGLVALDPSGLGVCCGARTALLRVNSSGFAQVRRLAVLIVAAVVEVVLGGVRNILERDPVIEADVLDLDDARRIQLERAAYVIVRGIRFSLGRGCGDDAEPVLRNGTDVVEPRVLGGVCVAPAQFMFEGGGLAVHRCDLAVIRRRRGLHVDLIPVDGLAAGGLHRAPGELRTGALVCDEGTHDGQLLVVDLRGLHDLAVLDHIHDPFQQESAVVAEVHLAVHDVPGAVFIRCHTVVVEVDLAVFDAPPAVLVLCNTGVVEVYSAVLEVPPAVFVLRDTGVARDGSAVLHTPPAGPGLDGAVLRAAVADLDLTVLQVPERGLAGRLGDLFAPLVRVDGGTVLLRDDVVDLEVAVILEVDLAASDEPVAVIVVVDAVGLEVDLAVLNAPPAILVRDDAVVVHRLVVSALFKGIPLAVLRLTDFQVRDLVAAGGVGKNGVKPQPDDAS